MSVPQTEAAPDAVPALRLLSAPACEPPYDDEHAPSAPVRPAARPAPPRLRLVPPPSGRTTARTPRRPAVLDDDGVARSRTADLAPSGPFARALVQRLVEVRAGVRPLPQLQRDTTAGLYAELERHLRRRPSGPPAGVRQVLSVHVQDRPDGVAEVCATVRDGERVRALALRLEALHGRWTCTLLLGL